MNDYRMGTKCVQAGYKPGNGEPRQIDREEHEQSDKHEQNEDRDITAAGASPLFSFLNNAHLPSSLSIEYSCHRLADNVVNEYHHDEQQEADSAGVTHFVTD